MSTPPLVPIRNVHGQVELFSPELTTEDVRELFKDLNVKGNREGLFAATPEGIPSWP